MYLEFALSSNKRGRAVAAAMASRVDLKGKPYLDVGCADDGFLVACAENGAETVGFDVNRLLLDLAREDFKDAGLTLKVFRKDITSWEDVGEFEGRFDLITCSDVIEHVADPRITIENMSRLPRAGGSTYFEIPNQDAATAVLSDGHYHLFGVVQLVRDDARSYSCEHAPGRPYEVEHYLTLDDYGELCRRAGLPIEVLPATLEHTSLLATDQHLDEVRRSVEARLLNVPEKARVKVRSAVQHYLFLAAADRDLLGSQDYLLRHGAAFSTVLARKVESVATRRPIAAVPGNPEESNSSVQSLSSASSMAAE